MIIAHNDAAPYNAVWDDQDKLVGFIDWDMAGPRHRDDDLAWTAFSWVPLHARHVVAAEGFTRFAERRERLADFVRAYGSELSVEQVLRRLDAVLAEQVELIRDRARHDPTYRRMIELGRASDLGVARAELSELRSTRPRG